MLTVGVGDEESAVQVLVATVEAGTGTGVHNSSRECSSSELFHPNIFNNYNGSLHEEDHPSSIINHLTITTSINY